MKWTTLLLGCLIPIALMSGFWAHHRMSAEQDHRARRVAQLMERRAPDIKAHPNINTASLEELVASLLPTDAENKWLQIPWRTDVQAARVEAARDVRPVFMWLMDGDPLGCT